MALLPLFPLDVVLLPGAPLPLHIFEPRYREMIAECRARETPFGVIRALEEGIAEVGCTAEIVSVTKEYPDGRLDLVAEGRKRFEVLELNRNRSFLRAEILLIADEPGAAAAEDKARAIQLHLEILSLAGAVQDLAAADQSARKTTHERNPQQINFSDYTRRNQWAFSTASTVRESEIQDRKLGAHRACPFPPAFSRARDARRRFGRIVSRYAATA